MSKRLLPLALVSLLLPAAGWAQESQPPATDSKPAEAQPAPAKEPEKSAGEEAGRVPVLLRQEAGGEEEGAGGPEGSRGSEAGPGRPQSF